jgi:hypothetical protein
VPEKNENRESTRFADLAQIFTAYCSDRFTDKFEKKKSKFFNFFTLKFLVLQFLNKMTHFSKNLKSVLSEIIYILRKLEETVRLES